MKYIEYIEFVQYIQYIEFIQYIQYIVLTQCTEYIEIYEKTYIFFCWLCPVYELRLLFFLISLGKCKQLLAPL